MRILVLSDTHDKITNAVEVYNTLSQKGKIDLIVHAGDYISDAKNLGYNLNAPILAVHGNCDSRDDDYAILETEAGNIFLTHGHDFNIHLGVENLVLKAKELGCIGVIYGHTHKAHYENKNGIFLLNPGSITKPRDIIGDGSFALLITGKDMVWAKIYRFSQLEDLKEENKQVSKKITGGNLVEKINYSDRF